MLKKLGVHLYTLDPRWIRPWAAQGERGGADGTRERRRCSPEAARPLRPEEEGSAEEGSAEEGSTEEDGSAEEGSTEEEGSAEEGSAEEGSTEEAGGGAEERPGIERERCRPAAAWRPAAAAWRPAAAAWRPAAEEGSLTASASVPSALCLSEMRGVGGEEETG